MSSSRAMARQRSYAWRSCCGSFNERFNMMVPYARAVNPITKTNWEGVGVKPHIEVETSQALEKAKELAAAEIKKRRGTSSEPR